MSKFLYGLPELAGSNLWQWDRQTAKEPDHLHLLLLLVSGCVCVRGGKYMEISLSIWSGFMQQHLRKAYISLKGLAVYNHPNLPNLTPQGWAGDGKSLV